jgi:hypothetical protein
VPYRLKSAASERAWAPRGRSLYLGALAALVSLWLRPATGLADPAGTVTLGPATVTLGGPWKFHLGDALAWASPQFDDSSWDTLDLTAPPGAHDGDVGISGYVPGWSARGYAGYSGYAWYRLRISVSAAAGSELALTTPTLLDHAYQLYVNGRLLGGIGNFSAATPGVYGIQPRVYRLPRALLDPDGSLLIALRVWRGPWGLTDPKGGGIHVAPVLGELHAIEALNQFQWQQTVRGYIVDALLAVAFALLALMAYCTGMLERQRRDYRWLIAALLFTGLQRANQPGLFWGQFETLQGYEVLTVVLLVPAALAAWTLAWRDWFRLRDAFGLAWLVAILTLAYASCQFLTRSWFHGVLSPSVIETARSFGQGLRLGFVILTALIVGRALRAARRPDLRGLCALVLISIGQFAAELTELGVRGIWFPFGVGVSRTEFAYAAFAVVLFSALFRRLRAVAIEASRSQPLALRPPLPGRR